MPTPAEAKAARDARAAALLADAAARARAAVPPPYITPSKPLEPDKAHPTASSDFKTRARTEGDALEDQAESIGAESDDADQAGKQLRAQREQERQSTPVSFGGERIPSFVGALASRYVEGAKSGLGFAGDVGNALLPQLADTPAQAGDRDVRSTEAGEDRLEASKEIANRLANIEQGSKSPAEFTALVEQATTPAWIDADEYAPRTAGRSDAQAALIEQYPELADPIDANNKAVNDAATVSRLADAAAGHESPAAYALRLLGAPASAASAVLEAAATDKTIGETLPARLRGGEGFTGAGIDAGRAVGTKVGTALEDATGLPVADNIRRAGTFFGGLAGFGADLAVPVDLGIGDLVTGGKLARKAVEGVPRELTPSVLERAVTSVIPGTASTPQTRSLAELRNKVGGIPELHAVEARRLSVEADVPILDAAAFQLAEGLGERSAAPGDALVTQLSRALGGETDVVTAAGVAEGQATRARLLAERAATTERAGTAARTAAADLEELRRLEADDLDLAASLRQQGNTVAAERIETRVAESSRITKAEQVAQFKAANLEKYQAQRAEVARLRVEEALRLKAIAEAARSKADTFLHYGRVADAILSEGPKKGTAARVEKLVEDVRALLAPKVQMAPGDARRALGGAYMQAKTFDLVAEVIGKSADPTMASVRAEIELGPEAFLDAIKVKAPQLAKNIEKASQLGDNSALGKLLNDRAAVARKLVEYDAVTAGAPLRTRQAWSWLQQTVGYGVPLISDTGKPLIAGALGAAAREGASIANGALRSGMLSGFLVPNPKFFANNMLTAPAIILSTLGPRMALGSVLSFDGITVQKAMQGDPAALTREIVRLADGTVYTGQDIARIVASNGISRSQAVEELGSRGIEQLIEFGQRASDGRLKSHLKSLGGYGTNLWAELANMSDGFFRINVLTTALKDGRPVEEAVILARESLFDYGNLTDFERNYLGKVVWFWTFRRNNYRSMMRNVLSNPARLSSLAAINNASSEAIPNGIDGSYLATQHYAENSPMWRMVTDEESQLRYALNGPSIPVVQATEDYMDALSMLALVAEDHTRNTGGHGDRAAFDRLATSAAGNTNPVTAFAISQLFGVNIQNGADAKLSGTLDARLVWYLQQVPGGWEWAVTKFDLVEVDDADEVKSGGNYIPGRKSDKGTGQWKIGSDSGKKNWQLAMFALAGVGAQRPLREFSPWLAWGKELAGGSVDAVSPSMGNAPGETPWDRLGILAGVLTPTNMPAFENTVERNAAVRESEVIPP